MPMSLKRQAINGLSVALRGFEGVSSNLVGGPFQKQNMACNRPGLDGAVIVY
jgi:hypothetical protein